MSIVLVPVDVPAGAHLVAVIPVTRHMDDFTAEHLQIEPVNMNTLSGVLKILGDALEVESLTQEFDVHTRTDPDVDMIIAASDKLAHQLGDD